MPAPIQPIVSVVSVDLDGKGRSRGGRFWVVSCKILRYPHTDSSTGLSADSVRRVAGAPPSRAEMFDYGRAGRALGVSRVRTSAGTGGIAVERGGALGVRQ